MQLELNVIAFLAALFTGAAIISSITVAILLLRQTGVKRPRWLVGLLFASATFLVNMTVGIGNFPSLSEHFYYLPMQLSFALGPCLYFYARSLLEPQRVFRRNDWLHLIIPLMQALLHLGLGFSSIDTKFRFYQDVELVWYGRFALVWVFGNVMAYGLTVWVMLRRAHSAEHTPLSPLTFSWLRGLTLAVLIAVVATLFWDHVLPPIVSAAADVDLDAFISYNVAPSILISLTLLWVSANAYLYTLRSQLAAVPVARPRKETYSIDAATLTASARQLEALMTDEQVYREPDLTLRSLAKRLDLSSQQLSYVINEATSQNFNSYINQHRIVDAKRLLRDPSNNHQSVLDLAFEAGFSSKSTFNRVFKELVGSSPSQFRAAESAD